MYETLLKSMGSKVGVFCGAMMRSVDGAVAVYVSAGLMLARTLRSFANLISSSKLRQESELLVAVETVMVGEGEEVQTMTLADTC